MNKAAYYQGYLQKEADLKTSLAKIFASKFWTKAAPEGARPYGIGSKVGEPVRERATGFLSKLLAKDTSTFGPGQWAWELGMPAALGVGGTAHSYANQPKDDKDMTLAALSGLGLAGMAAPGTFRYVGSNVKSAPLGHGLEALGRTALGIGAVKIGGPAALGTLKDVQRSTKNVANISEDTASVAGDVTSRLNEAVHNLAEGTHAAKSVVEREEKSRSLSAVLDEGFSDLPKKIGEAFMPVVREAMSPISDLPKNMSKELVPVVRETMSPINAAIEAVRETAGKAAGVAPYAAALALLGVAGYAAAGHKKDRSMAEQQATLPSISIYQAKYPYLSVKELRQVASGQAQEWVMARRNKKREDAEQIQAR